MVVFVSYDVSSVLPAPLPLIRINGGEWIVVRRADVGIGPYGILSNCAYINRCMSSGRGAVMWRGSFVSGCRSHSS